MLRIDNLEISVNENILLKIDYFNLNAGEKAAIIGNNDSGKSLVLKAIHGDFTDFKGNIFIKEKASIFYKKRKHTILIDPTCRILEKENLWKNLTLPLPGLSSRTAQKLEKFCEIAGLKDKLKMKAKYMSFSTLKMIELIRAVIQLPYIILVDDFDNFFDDLKLNQVREIFDYATNNGSCILVTAKQRLDDFEFNYRIQNGILAKL